MQYKNYTIQLVSDSYIIRDCSGKYVAACPTDDEAREYIDDLIDDKIEVQSTHKIDYYKIFTNYCKNLPGKCFIDDKLCTTNEAALNRYIKSFENSHDVKINYSYQYIDGEYLYMVTSIID